MEHIKLANIWYRNASIDKFLSNSQLFLRCCPQFEGYDNQETSSIDAEIVSVSKEGKEVTLRRATDGKEGSFELTKFSEKDKNYIQEFQKLKINLNPTAARPEYVLGLRYKHGLGVPEDEEKAAEWFEKSARRGYAPAMRELGKIGLYKVDWEKGLVELSEDPNFDNAIKFLYKATDKGDVDAKFHLGKFNSRYSLHPGGFVLLHDAMRKGYIEAETILVEQKPSMEELDEIYDNGLDYWEAIGKSSNSQNRKDAIACFRMGAYYNHPASQFRLAFLYLDGVPGIKRDVGAALTLLNSAMKISATDAYQRRDTQALSLFGRIHMAFALVEERSGRKGSPEYNRCVDVAIGSLDMASEKGDLDAIYWLGFMKTQNIGIKGKRGEGLRQMQHALDMGYR